MGFSSAWRKAILSELDWRQLKGVKHRPIVAIAASGAALVALGSIFSAGARKLSQSIGGSGGGYSSAPSLRNTEPSYGPSEYRGPYRDDFTVEFRIGSNELVGVLDTAEQRRNRLG